MPAPFGGRDYINDFSPTYQIFKIKIPANDYTQWSRTLPANTNLFVQLWQQSIDSKNRLILNERIHDPSLRLVVYNMHSPEGKSAYISADGNHRSATHGIKIGTRPMHPKTYRYFGPSDYRRQAVESLALELTNRLQTRYRIVITRGENGKKIVDYPLVIAPGRGKARTALTGTLRSLGDGGVVLTNNIQSSSYAGMHFIGEWTSSNRFKNWVNREVKESSKGSGNKGIFSLPTFISMSFDKKGQCIVKDFKYTISRGQRIGQSNWYRKAWITTLLHFKPAPVINPGKIKGTYTCIANGETWKVDHIVSFGIKDKKRHNSVRGSGSWTLTQQDNTWRFQIHPNQAPISEMMVPIEAILEEE